MTPGRNKILAGRSQSIQKHKEKQDLAKRRQNFIGLTHEKVTREEIKKLRKGQIDAS